MARAMRSRLAKKIRKRYWRYRRGHWIVCLRQFPRWPKKMSIDHILRLLTKEFKV